MGNKKGDNQTKTESAKYVLDQAGYTVNKNLLELKLLEPSFGQGNIIVEAATRLLMVARSRGLLYAATLIPALKGYEISGEAYGITRARLFSLLRNYHVANPDSVINAWIVLDDFLKCQRDEYDFVIANPPYISTSHIEFSYKKFLKQKYRSFQRSTNIYYAFIEESLRCLNDKGKAWIILPKTFLNKSCSDDLKNLLSTEFGLNAYYEIELNFDPTTIFETALYQFSKKVSKSTWVFQKDKPPAQASIENLHNPIIEDFIIPFKQFKPFKYKNSLHIQTGLITGLDSFFISPTKDHGELSLKAATAKSLRGNKQLFILALEENTELTPELEALVRGNEEILRKRTKSQNKHSKWYTLRQTISPKLKDKTKILIPSIQKNNEAYLDKTGMIPLNSIISISGTEDDLDKLMIIFNSFIFKLYIMAYAEKVNNGYNRITTTLIRDMSFPDKAFELINPKIEKEDINEHLIDILKLPYYLKDLPKILKE